MIGGSGVGVEVGIGVRVGGGVVGIAVGSGVVVCDGVGEGDAVGVAVFSGRDVDVGVALGVAVGDGVGDVVGVDDGVGVVVGVETKSIAKSDDTASVELLPCSITALIFEVKTRPSRACPAFSHRSALEAPVWILPVLYPSEYSGPEICEAGMTS